jgi:hypothetical protein
VLATILTSTLGLAKESDPYVVPRTEHGHPDFQAVWATAFLTRLERPEGVERLIANLDQALAVATTIRARIPEVIDPDVAAYDFSQLAMSTAHP